MNGFLLFILCSAAVFRITRIIVLDKIGYIIRKPFIEEIEVTEEDGTESIYTRKRYETGIGNWVGELLSCYWCVGVWVSAFVYTLFSILPVIGVPFVWIFAVAGASSIIQHYIERS